MQGGWVHLSFEARTPGLSLRNCSPRGTYFQAIARFPRNAFSTAMDGMHFDPLAPTALRRCTGLPLDIPVSVPETHFQHRTSTTSACNSRGPALPEKDGQTTVCVPDLEYSPSRYRTALRRLQSASRGM